MSVYASLRWNNVAKRRGQRAPLSMPFFIPHWRSRTDREAERVWLASCRGDRAGVTAVDNALAEEEEGSSSALLMHLLLSGRLDWGAPVTMPNLWG